MEYGKLSSLVPMYKVQSTDTLSQTQLARVHVLEESDHVVSSSDKWTHRTVQLTMNRERVGVHRFHVDGLSGGQSGEYHVSRLIVLVAGS